MSTLLGVGSASVLSRAIGKGDQKTVDKIMGNLIFWVILFSAIITVGGILLAPHFLDMVGATGEIKAYGIRYLRVIFIGSLFVNFTQSENMVMRGEGLMKKAMMIMGLGALLNIILDPILMTVMGEYAIEGAALATITAQFVQAVVTLHYFLKKNKVVKTGIEGLNQIKDYIDNINSNPDDEDEVNIAWLLTTGIFSEKVEQKSKEYKDNGEANIRLVDGRKFVEMIFNAGIDLLDLKKFN